MITNNNVEAYIELLKERIAELESKKEASPEFPHIWSDLFNLRKELLTVRETAEYHSRHLKAIKEDIIWKKASCSYQSSHLKVMERIAFASENQASALHSVAAALRGREESARELILKHGWAVPSPEQQELNLHNNTGIEYLSHPISCEDGNKDE